jgi:hypothetical protein
MAIEHKFDCNLNVIGLTNESIEEFVERSINRMQQCTFNDCINAANNPILDEPWALYGAINPSTGKRAFAKAPSIAPNPLRIPQ